MKDIKSECQKIENIVHDLFAPEIVPKKDAISIVCTYLMYKAERLYCNTLILLQEKQFHSSAYLVRGLIEIWADMSYLLVKKDQKMALKFLETKDIIRQSQVKINFKNFPNIKSYWTDKQIIQRIEMLGRDSVVWTYRYFSASTHSSSIGLGTMIHKEEEKCISEQRLVSSHVIIEIATLFIDNVYPEKKLEKGQLWGIFNGNFIDKDLIKKTPNNKTPVE